MNNNNFLYSLEKLVKKFNQLHVDISKCIVFANIEDLKEKQWLNTEFGTFKCAYTPLLPKDGFIMLPTDIISVIDMKENEELLETMTYQHINAGI